MMNSYLPIKSYFRSWKSFRQKSNENLLTAKQIINQRYWPTRNKVKIMDIGCGDGNILEEIIKLSKGQISEAKLIDPNSEMLDEAYKALCRYNISIIKHHSKAEDFSSDLLNGINAILMIHVIYLIDESFLDWLLSIIPNDVPLYLVIDTGGSVFAKFWEKFSNKFLLKAKASENKIKSLQKNKYHVNFSKITSYLENPLALPLDIKNEILSFLCYYETINMSKQDYEWVHNQIKNGLVLDRLPCESNCYEIVKIE